MTVTTQGDSGQPKPAVVIQTDAFDEHATVTVLPISGTLVYVPPFRIGAEPSAANGLRRPSQVRVDKAMTVRHDRLGPAFGHIEADAMVQLDRCLAVFLGVAR